MNDKSLTKNSIYYLIYNILNVIFPFLTGIYVARVIFPEIIGQVEIARNFAQYFVVLSFLGIPTYGLREISKYRNKKNKLNKIYSELMIINFISTVLFTILYLLLIFSIPEYRKYIQLFLITGLAIILNIFNNSWLFEGLEEFKYISLRNIIFKVVSFFLLVIFVKSSNDYLKYAIITVVGTAGNYFVNLFNSHKFVKFSFKNINLKQHLKPIAFLVIVNIAIEIYSLIDVTMLGQMCSREIVAFYSYGNKIYRILLQIVNTFTMVLVPKIALYYQEKRLDKYNEVISKTMKVILLISIPLVIGIWFTSDFLITKIYGDVYIKSSHVLKILSIILIASPIGYLLGSRVCLVTNNENKMIIPVFCGAIVNIVLNFCLIHIFEELGAAIASVIGELIVMSVYICIGKKYYKLVNISSSLKKEIAAVFFMIINLIIVSNFHFNDFYMTIIQIISSIFIYFGVLLLLKEELVYNLYYKAINRVKYFLKID